MERFKPIIKRTTVKGTMSRWFPFKEEKLDTRVFKRLLRLSTCMLFQVKPDLIEFKSIQGVRKK